MAGDQSIDVNSDVRTAWSQMGNAKNDDVCKSEVERELSNYYAAEKYLGQRANE